MEEIKLDKRALSEVYAVISMLEEDRYKKIPKELINGIRNNMDEEYEVNVDELEEEMLPDTERILATIYAYYLANKEEKDTIFQIIELEKKKEYSKKYGDNEIFTKKEDDEKKLERIQSQTNEGLEIISIKNSFFSKIINNIKNLLRKFF